MAPDPSAPGNADVPGPEGWGALVPADRSQGAPEEMRIATTPRSVAQQMAQQTAQISAMAGGRVDLRLDPEELGRVAMQIHTEGDRITLIIAAERGDTTELIRRHLQELAGELRALGYRSVSLGFEGGRGGRWDAAAERGRPGSPGPLAAGRGAKRRNPPPSSGSAPHGPRSPSLGKADMTLIPDATAQLPAPVRVEGRPGLTDAADFQMFLKMLTAQIRNQDPLEPMESADYAVQLATFSGVEQQVRTNELLAALSESRGQGDLSQVAAWVGREVRAPVPATFDGAPLDISFETRPGAEAGLLVVSDAAGREVMRHEVPPGPQSFQWAGTDARGMPLPAGDYGFAIASLSGGKRSAATWSKPMAACARRGSRPGA
ncbi:flagellar hook capping FlgD N-terminal domain-containing protein [Limimaricola soesokkakensis]|uniref:flagellar hook capping FlgD N-terminal domain-containing protein n=2 Tax=Limimaricola soesokkakensis TaxID=1343159 RepID=UPI0035171DE5